MTATEAASKIGCSVATVTRWAKFLGFSKKYGSALFLNEKQVKTIKARWHQRRGNPNFVKK
jgi:hypothetical protein